MCCTVMNASNLPLGNHFYFHADYRSLSGLPYEVMYFHRGWLVV
jgi:hypothetical protein